MEWRIWTSGGDEKKQNRESLKSKNKLNSLWLQISLQWQVCLGHEVSFIERVVSNSKTCNLYMIPFIVLTPGGFLKRNTKMNLMNPCKHGQSIILLKRFTELSGVFPPIWSVTLFFQMLTHNHTTKLNIFQTPNYTIHITNRESLGRKYGKRDSCDDLTASQDKWKSLLRNISEAPL